MPGREVLIAGASGFIGRALSSFLGSDGYAVKTLGRHSGDFQWNPDEGNFDPALVSSFDYVINLCGENLAEGRWSEERKHRLLHSRVAPTHLLSLALAQHGKQDATLLNASAVGFYGNRGDDLLDETAAAGDSFLSHLCIEWEAATAAAREAGRRVVLLRFGVILDREGGALKKMLPPFSMGMGGPLGHGTQYMSWISLRDTLRAVRHCMQTPLIEGPVNIGAPEASRNADFARELGDALHRPALIPVPAMALRMLFGDMADEALLSSARAFPRQLLDSGFEFSDRTLHEALASALS